MRIIDIVLVLIIIYIIYLFSNYNEFFTNNKSPNNPTNKHNIYNNLVSEYWDKHDKNYDQNYDQKYTDDLTNISGYAIKHKINPNFLSIQFHNDYRDVITAINNLIPNKKQLFNLSNRPIAYSEPQVKEVYDLVSDFVNALNIN